jgi:Flp pilus assembly protein TadD
MRPSNKFFSYAAILTLSLAGCAYDGAEMLPLVPPPPPSEEVILSPTFQSGPEQPLVDKAKVHFRNGEYGLAELDFRQAVQLRYQNAEAWLGLAASYDHLKRFEEADRAYNVLEKMVGHTPTVLNNLGYHYMLKGEFGSAEHALLTAQSQDPNNPLICANLALLAEWKAAAGRSS